MAPETPGQVLSKAKKFTGWYIVAAILFIVLGIFAIIEPAVAGLGVALLVGWLLVFGGIFHFISAFEGGGARRVIGQILAGIVFLLGGVYLLLNPIPTLATLTVFVATVIFLAGVFEIVSYFNVRPELASGWLLFNGIAALFLGGLIFYGWPSSSAWAIGTLVGVYLLLTGITRLMFGLKGRSLLKQVTG